MLILTASDDPLTAEDFLEMARESINALGKPVGKRTLLHRLTAAAAELGEAIKDTGDVGLQALELQKAVYHAAEEAQALREDDEIGINAIRRSILDAVQRPVL